MRVLLINGSPHQKGNTSIALAEVAKTLEQEGIETVTICIGVRHQRMSNIVTPSIYSG